MNRAGDLPYGHFSFHRQNPLMNHLPCPRPQDSSSQNPPLPVTDDFSCSLRFPIGMSPVHLFKGKTVGYIGDASFLRFRFRKPDMRQFRGSVKVARGTIP